MGLPIALAWVIGTYMSPIQFPYDHGIARVKSRLAISTSGPAAAPSRGSFDPGKHQLASIRDLDILGQLVDLKFISGSVVLTFACIAALMVSVLRLYLCGVNQLRDAD